MYIAVKYTQVLYTAVKYTAVTQSAFIFNTGMFNPLFIIEVNIVTSVFNIEVRYILRRAMQTLQLLRLYHIATKRGQQQGPPIGPRKIGNVF